MPKNSPIMINIEIDNVIFHVFLVQPNSILDLSRMTTQSIVKDERISSGHPNTIFPTKSAPDTISPGEKLLFLVNVAPSCKNVLVTWVSHSEVPVPPGVSDIELAVDVMSPTTILAQYGLM